QRIGACSGTSCSYINFNLPLMSGEPTMLRWVMCLPWLFFVSILLAQEPKKPRPPVQLSDEAQRIHRDAIVIDGHNDLPWMFREKKDLSFSKVDITKPCKDLHTDIPRLRQGGVGAQFWSAFVPASSRKDGSAVRMTLEQIDVILRMVKSHPNDFEMA